MTKKPPVGAIPEDELKNLRKIYQIKKSPQGYYLVYGNGYLSINGNYSFIGKPPSYYFTNYFFALGYHLRVLSKGELDHEK